MQPEAAGYRCGGAVGQFFSVAELIRQAHKFIAVNAGKVVGDAAFAEAFAHKVSQAAALRLPDAGNLDAGGVKFAGGS